MRKASALALDLSGWAPIKDGAWTMPDNEQEAPANDRSGTETPSSDRYRYGCVAFNLRRATRIVTRRYEEALHPLGIKAFQFTALAALSDNDVIPLPTIAELFGMDLSTASRNVKAMDRKGWLRIINDPEDRRRKLVLATEEGRALFKQAIPFWERAQAETAKLMTGFDWGHERSWLNAISRHVGGEEN